MIRTSKCPGGTCGALLIIWAFCLLLPEADARAAGADSAPGDVATVDVDAAKVTGKASPYIFGQNMEQEHGTISGGEQNVDNAHGLHSGGLWAEMLRDRKLEEGDVGGDGIANARVQGRLQHWVEKARPSATRRARQGVLGGGAGMRGHETSARHRRFSAAPGRRSTVPRFLERYFCFQGQARPGPRVREWACGIGRRRSLRDRRGGRGCKLSREPHRVP